MNAAWNGVCNDQKIQSDRFKEAKVSDMKPTKILCPVDFSPCSNVAFQHAVDLARGSEAALVLAHVSAPPPTYISGYSGYGALPPYQPEPDPRLEEMALANQTVKLDRVHLVGIEGEAIGMVDLATRWMSFR